MKLLALDSSGLVASAAIVTEEELIAEYTVQYKKTHSRTLLPMLDEICRMTELDPAEIDAVAVACGPGSFTGLRIGSATAKGIGLALGKPLIEVPTLKAMAYGLAGAGDAVLCPVMDARRGQVYNAVYRARGGELVTVAEQRALSVEELCEELGRTALADLPVVFLGDGVPVYREKIDSLFRLPHRYAPVHLARQRAASVGALALQMAASGEGIVSAETHAPVYLRKSQAEREREAKPCRFRIREMTVEDLPEVCQIEENCFTGESWSEKDLYTYLLRADALLIVAESSEDGEPEETKELKETEARGEILGYAGLLMVPEESDLISIAVAPKARRRGVATALLSEIRQMGAGRGVTVIHLEVRAGNEAAIRFYEKEGFTRDGIRKRYYRDPVEDAVNMTWRSL